MSGYLLVASAKDEAASILEWVAHHRLCGFDPIYVYQNDSTDLTVETLQELDRIGAIRYFDNSENPGAKQVRAYRRVAKTEHYQQSDWCVALDLDEFLNVKVGKRQVSDLVAACQGADAIVVNWQNFGSGGFLSVSEKLVTERFVRCQSKDRYAPNLQGYKTLFRSGSFERPGVHNPVNPSINDVRILNGSSLSETEFEKRAWRSTDPLNCRYAQINHYIIKDVASFINKRLRGNAHQSQREIGLKYWRQNDHSDGEDRGLADRSGALKNEMEILDAASDGLLMKYRREAHRHVRQSFLAALADPSHRRIYDQVCRYIQTNKPDA